MVTGQAVTWGAARIAYRAQTQSRLAIGDQLERLEVRGTQPSPDCSRGTSMNATFQKQMRGTPLAQRASGLQVSQAVPGLSKGGEASACHLSPGGGPVNDVWASWWAASPSPSPSPNSSERPGLCGRQRTGAGLRSGSRGKQRGRHPGASPPHLPFTCPPHLRHLQLAANPSPGPCTPPRRAARHGRRWRCGRLRRRSGPRARCWRARWGTTPRSSWGSACCRGSGESGLAALLVPY